MYLTIAIITFILVIILAAVFISTDGIEGYKLRPEERPYAYIIAPLIALILAMAWPLGLAGLFIIGLSTYLRNRNEKEEVDEEL